MMFTNIPCKKKGRCVDTSMHTGYIHLIRQARHTLYVETQFSFPAVPNDRSKLLLQYQILPREWSTVKDA